MTAQHVLTVRTRGRGFVDITREAAAFVQEQRLGMGLLTVFIQHTSASLVVSENADPDVLGDLERFFSRLVPDGDRIYEHTAEGPDDMPSHVRSALTQSQVSIPIRDGKLMLGTWQAVYVYEHRHAAHTRHVVLHCTGA